MNVPGKLTDSTGGSATETLAAATNTDSLTITGLTGVADASMTDITFNGTWSQGQADTVDKNFKEVGVELALQRSLNTVLINAMASMASKINKLTDTIRSLAR